jgi:hypothetical protein
MPVWLDIRIGVVGGLGLLTFVFWFAFARMPSRRSDGGLTQHDAGQYWNADRPRVAATKLFERVARVLQLLKTSPAAMSHK